MAAFHSTNQIRELVHGGERVQAAGSILGPPLEHLERRSQVDPLADFVLALRRATFSVEALVEFVAEPTGQLVLAARASDQPAPLLAGRRPKQTRPASRLLAAGHPGHHRGGGGGGGLASCPSSRKLGGQLVGEQAKLGPRNEEERAYEGALSRCELHVALMDQCTTRPQVVGAALRAQVAALVCSETDLGARFLARLSIKFGPRKRWTQAAGSAINQAARASINAPGALPFKGERADGYDHNG